MGLIGGILQPLYGGFPVVLMAPVAFLQRPIRWLEAISRYGATTSGGPSFAYDLCVRKTTPEQREGLDLRSWEVAFNGAEPVRAEAMARFAEAFEASGFRREAFYPCYGLAEATLIVSGGEKAAPAVVEAFEARELERRRVVVASEGEGDSRRLVGCGRTLPDQQIVVVDPERLTRSPPDQVGEIWVSGPSVAAGYWGQPEETAGTFEARLADTGEGPFLRTGDLGFVREGELFITGRIKDLIIVRGRNHYPQDIEATVGQSHPALQVDGGAAFSVEVDGAERLVIVQEVERTQRDAEVEEVGRAVRQAVAEEHELQVHAIVLIRPMSIPRTSSGKIQRHLCRAGFLEGSLKVIGSSILDTPPAGEPGFGEAEEGFIYRAPRAIDAPSARQASLVLCLQERAARVLGVVPSQVDVERPLSTLGLDSLMAVELAHEIESELGVVLPVTRVLQGPSISHLATQILAETARPRATTPVVTPGGGGAGEYPLTHGQRAMWLLHRLSPAGGAYHIANAVRIRTEVDVPALRRALQGLVDRHASLRTTFPVLEGEPVQRVHEGGDVCFEEEDASTWGERLLSERLAEEAHRPFDLEEGPLLRVHLYSCVGGEHVLLVVVHHIVADFWSLAVMAKELGILYPAERDGVRASLPAVRLQYADYARWQAEVLAGAEGERWWVYWQEALGGGVEVLDLPTDRPRPGVQTTRGSSRALAVGEGLTGELDRLSQAKGVTRYVTLLAAFQVLLYRYTGQGEIVVGSPTAGRERADLAGLVGYLVNPVVMRGELSEGDTFEAVLGRVKESVLGALEHGGYPFPLLVERLRPERDAGRTPIFQVMFTLQKAPLAGSEALAAFALGEGGAQIEMGGLTLESVAVERRTAQFELAMEVAEVGGKLGVTLRYNSDLFEADSVERMLGHFRTLLGSVVAGPGQRISELPLLTEVERRRIVERWNETGMDYARETCLHELFEAQAERTPDRVAVVLEDGEVRGRGHLTYRALNRRANRLAHHLRGMGVGPETRVAVYVERSLEMVVGLLGTLKAGGAYVPLDPGHPRERIAQMLEDAGPLAVLTQEHLREGLLGRVVCLGAEWEVIARQSAANPRSLAAPESLAYVIYTSGSTGRPKGVQIAHRGVVNFLNSMGWRPGLTERDVLLSVTTVSFDIAGLEIFLPLMVGARVVLVGREVAGDGGRLLKRLAESGATVMQATPATWRLLLEVGWEGDRRLKILCGGEAFPRELANRLVERSGEVWNMYGPTETTIWSAIYAVEEGEGQVPIGRPIANTQLYVLDAHQQPVPVGVAGRLYVGGEGLARGYLRRAGLTAERFIPDPFSREGGARLYDTGDVARYLSSGEVEYVGRTDHQVKVRGFRVELGEIETVLGRHEEVGEAVVLAREEGRGDGRLVAYVVPADGQVPTTSELRRFLEERLPDYMIPSAFVALEALPLTPNGKVDRRALPAPARVRPELETAYVAPRSRLEQTIAQVWEEVLPVDEVGVHDNFFDLGGHSLLMARVHHRLQERLGEEVSLVEMFQYATVHTLARRLSQVKGEGTSVQRSRERVAVRSARGARVSEQRERRRRSRAKDPEGFEDL
jgi:amino acid adenylation domain-containing protein